MGKRTIVVGDIHGELDALQTLLSHLPELDANDTLLFIGDYVDRGPQSAQVIAFLRTELPKRTQARIVTLRGNHEDAWLKVVNEGWPDFTLPAQNGCLAALRSFTGGPPPVKGEFPTDLQEMETLSNGSFFPPDVVEWMRRLPYFHEDEHALYVHGGLPRVDGRWMHPSQYANPSDLIWCRETEFFTSYEGKLVVFGHTPAWNLPQQLSTYTPLDATDLYIAKCLIGLDTGCGKGGFLSAVELPSLRVYESRGAKAG